MKEKQIVRMFESIPKFDTYSHCNSTLEKVFKSNNLKSLIESLKKQKDKNEISLLDQISKINTDEPIDIYADEDSDLKKIHIEEENDIFDEINEHKEIIHSKKSDLKKKQELWRINTIEFKKRRLMPALDPFKYNPNYNSIYKNIPSFKIIDPKNTLSLNNSKSKSKGKNKKKSKSKNSNKNKSKEKDNNKEKPLITEANIRNNKNDEDKTPPKKNKMLHTIGNINIKSQFSSNKKDDLKLPKLTKLIKIKKIDSINSENQNHALRFSKYVPRKYFIHENNKNISYLNPINYIKPKNKTRSIDFDKMLQRNKNNLVYASCLKNPSFGQYNPKYTYIDINDKVKLFNPLERDLENRKKYLMRKLWASYNVNTEYQMVDNSKINN